VSATTTTTAPALGPALERSEDAWTRRAALVAAGLLLATHPISFLNLFVPVHPSAVLALLMLGALLWYLPQTLGELARRAALPFTLFFGWETLLVLGHALHWSYFAYWSNADLTINAFTYLLLPQVAFLTLGMAVGRDRGSLDRLLKVVLYSGATAVFFGVVFYILRPGFVHTAEVRTFGEMVFRYEEYLPRMNGYFNSMILGAVCSTTLGLALFSRLRPWVLAGITLICAIGSVMTMQRGSWILTGATALAALAVIAWRSVAQLARPRGVATLALVLTLLGAGAAATWRFAQNQPWLPVAVKEFDSRVLQLPFTVTERSDQWARALDLGQRYPLGVGLGMLGNKARDIDGLDQYAITDGDLFSIMAETGVVGLALFLALAGTAVARALLARRFDVAAPLLLLLAGATGTNLFDLYYISFVFWLLLGCAMALRRRAAEAPPA